MRLFAVASLETEKAARRGFQLTCFGTAFGFGVLGKERVAGSLFAALVAVPDVSEMKLKGTFQIMVAMAVVVSKAKMIIRGVLILNGRLSLWT
ncbi:MAG: hypothetical protein EBU34_10720 [Alphaproteobacteria bacterium]|jgi:hypothetical protein|nr:hypothetical protein [Alphaproteobacteria bacterium]